MLLVMQRKTQTLVPIAYGRVLRRARRRQRQIAWMGRVWRRIADPHFYLRAVLAISLLALLILPRGMDAWNRATGPRGVDGCGVIRVIDGDTVSLHCPGLPVERARLTGFDTPETSSPRCAAELAAGMQATWHLRRLIATAGNMRVSRGGLDRYDRRLVRMWLDGTDVARLMIAAGLARPYGGGARLGWCG